MPGRKIGNRFDWWEGKHPMGAAWNLKRDFHAVEHTFNSEKSRTLVPGTLGKFDKSCC